MTFDVNLIRENLIEIRNIYTELQKYKNISEEDFIDNLSLPWTIERGLLAGINIILDIGNHLLTALYKIYPKTYGEVIQELYLKKIISETTYSKIKGTGNFRNILVHEYVRIDPRRVYGNFHLFLEVLPSLIKEFTNFLE